ncbi:sporulation integral membrane protein YtvI [Clostridium intestinale]|jgi:sporulation integral membrane protein YtvI|uniref:Sporulation integral membrane protein YtvI n=2 Tax=Clostridium intestinale TaxID=36845 RepID=U2NIE0_9CLOT|nr:sporulation integral membrane protein YtvI [Clostridium intestinale]ERK28621.1 sporulation integral membrane protein YtvI [Clostridium intestinale URNW]QLY80015.1 sporulation integral membrane protein YtvI [Clostridium intestinale]
MKKFEDKISKLALFFILYTLGFIIFFKTLPYTVPFVLAALFALILRKPTKYLIKSFKLKDSLASIITTLLFFSILIITITILIGSLSSQIVNLTKNIQEYLSKNPGDLVTKFTEIQDYFYNLDIDPVIISSIQNATSGSISKIVNISVSVGSSVVTFVLSVASYIPYMLMIIIFTLLTTYFFTKKFATSDSRDLMSSLPLENNSFFVIFAKVRHKLITYGISYMLLILMSFIITLIGFTIFRVKYALILSMLCALLDLLPVLGMPMIYIPLIIYNLLIGNHLVAIGLLIWYVIVFITRQIIEPKVMSTSLGLNPVAVLAAIFIGLKANGVSGMFFCMFMVVFYAIFKEEGIL